MKMLLIKSLCNGMKGIRPTGLCPIVRSSFCTTDTSHVTQVSSSNYMGISSFPLNLITFIVVLAMKGLCYAKTKAFKGTYMSPAEASRYIKV